MISVGITTAPRGIAYIGQSLSSFFDEWPNITPHVFAEAGSPYYMGRSRVIEHRIPNGQPLLGCVMNWFTMATWLYHTTNTPYIMTCEDDIYWQPGSGESIRKLVSVLDSEQLPELPKHKIGFVSPYCSQMNAPRKKGWQPPRFLKSGWCGSLALLFPRESIHKILTNDNKFLNLTVSVEHPERGTQNLDYGIGRFLSEEGCQLITHSPTLVMHIGEVSTTLSNNTERANYSACRQPHI